MDFDTLGFSAITRYFNAFSSLKKAGIAFRLPLHPYVTVFLCAIFVAGLIILVHRRKALVGFQIFTLRRFFFRLRLINVEVEEIKEEENKNISQHFENVTGSYIGSNNNYCNVPKFLLENQKEYIELLKKEIESLKVKLSLLENSQTDK